MNNLKSHSSILIYLFLSLITLTTFWQVQNYDFINLDDNAYVINNNHVNSGISKENIIWAFTKSYAANWHPLTWLSHMVDCELFDLNPSGHHMNNLILHIINTLLLFHVLNKMTGAMLRSSFVAALFALHPLHVESVVWISERKDLLCALFWMLTMWAYAWYSEQPNMKRYLLVLTFLAMGLMSKAMIVTMPFVLLLLDFWPLGRFRFVGNRDPANKYNHQLKDITKYTPTRLILEKIPFFLLSAASSTITFIAQKTGGAVLSIGSLPLDVRTGNAVVSYMNYIVKMICPSNLAVFYPHPGMPPWWKITGAGILLLLISCFFIRSNRNYPFLLFGWLWYLGTLMPVIGFIQVGSQSMADRYTYIPLIGLFIAIVWIVPLNAIKDQYYRILLSVLALLTIFSLSLVSWHYLRSWRDSITLFEHTLNVTFNNSVIHYSLGNALANHADFEEAIMHYKEAIRINPNNAMAYSNMGIALSKKGQFQEAIRHHEQALQINPNFITARNNLGLIFSQMGNFGEAINQFKQALNIEPESPEIHYYLGLTYSSMGNKISAYKEYDILKTINPDLANILLGRISEFNHIE